MRTAGSPGFFQEEERSLWRLYERGDVTPSQKEAILVALRELAWDDAVHIAAPWERRSSLCGNWRRNLVSLDEQRPDGVTGCWTCLMAADWLDANSLPNSVARVTEEEKA